MKLVGPPGAQRSRALEREVPTARNVAASYAGTAAEGVVFLLLTPFLLRQLGLELYGLWILAVALGEWPQLFDLGVREAVAKYAAEHQARSDPESLRRLTSTAFTVTLALAVLALALLAGILWLGVPLVVQDAADVAMVRGALLLLGLSGVISLPAGLSTNLLEGLSRFEILNLFRIAQAALRLVLIVLVLQSGFGLMGMAAAEMASRLVLHVARWAAVYRIHPALVPRLRMDREALHAFLGFGLWSALRQGSEIGANRITEPILAYASGPVAVGAFAVARRLGSISVEVVNPLAGVLFPLGSELEASGRRAALREALLFSTKYALFVALPISMVLGIGAHPIQANWLGGRAPEVEPVLSIFAIVFLLDAFGLPSVVLLLGQGRARLLAMLALGQLAVVGGIGIALASQWGASGLALAALAAVLFLQVVVSVPTAARAGELPLSLIARRAVLPAWLAALPVGIFLWIFRDSLASGGLAGVAAWAFTGWSLYAILYWKVGLDANERAVLRRHLERLVLHRSRITNWEEGP